MRRIRRGSRSERSSCRPRLGRTGRESRREGRIHARRTGDRHVRRNDERRVDRRGEPQDGDRRPVACRRGDGRRREAHDNMASLQGVAWLQVRERRGFGRRHCVGDKLPAGLYGHQACRRRQGRAHVLHGAGAAAGRWRRHERHVQDGLSRHAPHPRRRKDFSHGFSRVGERKARERDSPLCVSHERFLHGCL